LRVISTRILRRRFQNGYLQSAQQVRLVSAGNGMQRWSFRPESRFLYKRKSPRCPWRSRTLRQADYPITDLSGEIALTGSELQPVGHGSLQLTKLRPERTFRNLKLDFHGDRKPCIRQRSYNYRRKSGAKFTYVPKTNITHDTDGGRLKLTNCKACSTRRLAEWCLTLNSAARAREGPQLSGNVQIPQLQISGQTFSD